MSTFWRLSFEKVSHITHTLCDTHDEMRDKISGIVRDMTIGWHLNCSTSNCCCHVLKCVFLVLWFSKRPVCAREWMAERLLYGSVLKPSHTLTRINFCVESRSWMGGRRICTHTMPSNKWAMPFYTIIYSNEFIVVFSYPLAVAFSLPSLILSHHRISFAHSFVYIRFAWWNWCDTRIFAYNGYAVL